MASTAHLINHLTTKNGSNNRQWEQYLAILIVALGSLGVIWAQYPVWQQPALNDDSFITLTYAKNLASGNGFVYNHPPATLGTTTPFFTMLVALLYLVLPGIDLVRNAILLSILPWVGTGILLYLSAHHLQFRPLASALVAIVPLTVINATWLSFIGMEIWLFQFLLVLSFYLTITHRPALAGLVVGFLFLTRGEGILVGGILSVYFFLTNKHHLLRFIGAGLFVFIAWTLYALPTFGTVLPGTLAAKVGHREFLLKHGRDASFIHVMGILLPSWLQSFNLGATIFSNPLLISAGLGLVMTLVSKAQRYWAFYPIWAAIYFVSYAIINPSTYPWYAFHFYFVLELLAGLGVGWLIDTALKHTGSKKMMVGSVAVIMALLLLVPNGYRGLQSVQSFSGDGRAPAYIAIADWLNHNTQPEDGIAALEIGYLGYYSHNRIIDLAGLTDPLVAAHIAQDGFTWGFWHYNPKYLLFNPATDNEAYLAGVRSAADRYREVARFPGGPDNLPLVLFERIN